MLDLGSFDLGPQMALQYKSDKLLAGFHLNVGHFKISSSEIDVSKDFLTHYES